MLIPTSLCSIFVCQNNGIAARVWAFLKCAQTVMHATVHGGCKNTERE